MSPSHAVRPADDATWGVPPNLEGHTTGFRRWTAVDERAGAVHTGFGISELDSGGRLDWHLHSYEESLYVIDGEITFFTTEAALVLRPGDYGLIPIGLPHALANTGGQTARLAALSAPQPRPAHGGDTFFVPDLPELEPVTVDARDPRTRSFGHIAPEHMDPAKQSQDLLAASASMRTALLVYSGITVKMMVDSDLGAQLSTMFMVQYEGLKGVISGHDHPLEETYLILEGEVEATFDGERYRLVPGDVAWAGVGCVHAFANPAPEPVRWLETQAPAPPARHSYRFERDWDYLRDAIGAPTKEVR
ncbi:MAG: cupin domain-containing protein [Actinomycetota bacterium]